MGAAPLRIRRLVTVVRHYARLLDLATRVDWANELRRTGADVHTHFDPVDWQSVTISLQRIPTSFCDLLCAHADQHGVAALAPPQSVRELGRTTVLLLHGRRADVLDVAEDAAGGFWDDRTVSHELTRVLAAADTHPAPLQCGEASLEFGPRTLIMGIINMTPDSFSGDGLAQATEAGVRQGRRFVEEGADLLDVGGESTRPGSESVPLAEELQRVIPVIEGLAQTVAVPISIDTSKAEVARRALDAGATIVNDIAALQGDPEMLPLCAERGCGVVLMHMQGTPRTMQAQPHYHDVMAEIYAFLADRLEAAVGAGVKPTQVILDPGFGFGKRLEDNLEILRRLREFRSLGRPLLVGTSRKSMIGQVLDLPADERLEGTAATCALAIRHGADILRVHDVRQMARVARMTDAVCRPQPAE